MRNYKDAQRTLKQLHAIRMLLNSVEYGADEPEFNEYDEPVAEDITMIDLLLERIILRVKAQLADNDHAVPV